MDGTLRKTIIYTKPLMENRQTVATLRGTINVGKVGSYTVSCTPSNQELYLAHKEEIDAEEKAFSDMVQAEADSDANIETVTSEDTEDTEEVN